MAWSFGNIFRDAARVYPQAFDRAQELKAMEPYRQLQELTAAKLRRELAEQELIEKTLKEAIEPERQRVSAIGSTAKMRRIAQLPPGRSRKIAVEAFTRQAKSQMGSMPAKSFTDFLMNADPEMLNRFFEDSETEMLAMPEVGPKQLMDAMSDDAAVADSVLKTQIEVEGERTADSEAEGKARAGGPLTAEQRLMNQDRRKARRAKAEFIAAQRQVSNLNNVVSRLRGAGVSEASIESRFGDQLTRSTAMLNDARDRFDKLRGNVREVKKGQIEEERQIEGEIRRDKLSDTNLWQAAGVELAKRATDRNPVQVILPDGTGMTVFSDGMGKFYDPSGKQVQLPPDARIAGASLQGGAQDIGLTNTTRSTIEQETMDMRNRIGRLETIKANFNPEFFKLTSEEGPIATGITKLQARLGAEPSAEQKMALENREAFKQKTADNANTEIRAITGAAMAVAETGRLLQQIPNIDDDWITFGAKLNSSIEMAQMALKRLDLFRQMGKSKEEIQQELKREDGPMFGMSLETAAQYFKRRDELKARIDKGTLTKQQATEKLYREFAIRIGD